MNRREIAVNVLCGGVLVGAFFLVALAGFAVILFLFRSLDWALSQFFPSLDPHRDVALLATMAALLLLTTFRQLRLQHWRWTTLAMMGTLALSLSVVNGMRHRTQFDTSSSFVLLMCCFAPDQKDDIAPRWFIGNAALIGAISLLSAGLLGSGTAARIADDCVHVAIFVWVFFAFRRRWFEDPSNPDSVSETA